MEQSWLVDQTAQKPGSKIGKEKKYISSNKERKAVKKILGKHQQAQTINNEERSDTESYNSELGNFEEVGQRQISEQELKMENYYIFNEAFLNRVTLEFRNEAKREAKVRLCLWD